MKINHFLLSLWLVSQLFIYKYMSGMLSLDLGFKLSVDKVIILILLITSIAKRNTDKYGKYAVPLPSKILFAFTIICLISFAIHNPDSYYGNHKWLVTIFNFSIIPLMGITMIVNYEFDEVDIFKMYKLLSIIGLYLAVVGIAEHYHLEQLIYPKYIVDELVRITQTGRAGGPFLNAGEMGRILIVTFVANLYCMKSKNVWKYFFYINGFMITAAIYFTNTRSPWIAFALVMLVNYYFLDKYYDKTEIIFMRLIFTAGIILISFGVLGKLSIFDGRTLFQTRTKTIDYRLVNYATSLNMIKDNPTLGIGYGMFSQRWEDYLPEKHYDNIKDDIELKDGNHNTFLGVVSEVGMLGSIPFFILMGMIFKESFKKHCKSHILRTSKIQLFLLSIFIIYVFTGNFADLRFYQTLNNMLYLIFGIVYTLAGKNYESI